jgi:hypothetical protein
VISGYFVACYLDLPPADHSPPALRRFSATGAMAHTGWCAVD